MAGAYYNEFDPEAAEWLRELIAHGLIAPGDVDERSIEDVAPNDLVGYRQVHLFAGIGGWSHALRIAGWPDDQPIWTCSCPCQPFSAAGQGGGFEDKRHLWPAAFHLIRERNPSRILGEQVAAKRADPWIDLVHADLEAVGYAFGCVPFPSAGIGAPQIRDRNYWMADTDDARSQGWGVPSERADERIARPSDMAGGLAHADGWHSGAEREQRSGQHGQQPEDGRVVQLASYRPGPVNGFWRDADWIGCADGFWRPVEPGTFPLAHGLPARVGRLRGYGNAINPYQAATFIRACQEARADRQRNVASEAA